MSTPWPDFADAANGHLSDVLLATRGGAGINIDLGKIHKDPTPAALTAILSGLEFNLAVVNGVSSPADGSSKAKIGLYFDSNPLNEAAAIDFRRGASAIDGSIVFRTNNVDRLYIDRFGNLGLGAFALGSSGKNFTISGVEASLVLAANGNKTFAIASGANFQYSPNSLIFYDLTIGAPRLLIMQNGTLAPGADNALSIGSSSLRWSTIFAGTGSINTSDQREKTNIEVIPEQWLDAWEIVQWSRFKFEGRKRWHLGLIAQRVHAAFLSFNLDAFEIGLCCFDQFDEVRVPETIINDEGQMVPTGKEVIQLEAGDRWGLRYDECFAIEAAWQRRERVRSAEKQMALEARIVALEQLV